MKIFGVYIVSKQNKIILSVNGTDSFTSFFPIIGDDPFITSATMKCASQYGGKHLPYLHNHKFYYGINDGVGHAYYLVSDTKDDGVIMPLLEQIKEIDLQFEEQNEKIAAIKHTICPNAAAMASPFDEILANIKSWF